MVAHAKSSCTSRSNSRSKSCSHVPPRGQSPGASQDDLGVLVNPRSESGFANVYRHDGGRWRARVWKYINLPGSFPTPTHAAFAVVGWYEQMFGAKWKDVFHHRQANPWRVRKVDGGYVAEIYVCGSPVPVGDVYASKEEARRAVRREMKRMAAVVYRV